MTTYKYCKPVFEGQETIERIREIFGNTPVRDAPADLRVFVSEEDVSGAIPRNVRECVFARACRRMFHSTAVVFFKTRAYIDMLDEDGNRVIDRYIFTEGVANAIIKFDMTGEGRSGGFTLKAPTKSTSLEASRKNSERIRNDPKRKQRVAAQNKANRRKRKAALIKGTIRPKTLADAGTPLNGLSKSVFIRSGTGLAQFVRKMEK